MINPPDDPAQLTLFLDWRVIAFGIALALGVTSLFGIAPALKASSVHPVSAMKGGEDVRFRGRLMNVSIGLQAAFCVLVLFAAGLFIGTFQRLARQTNGFTADRVLNIEAFTRSPQSPEFWNQAADRLRAMPGVEKVSMAGWPLMTGEMNVDMIAVNGGRASEVLSDFLTASPQWMDTLKVGFLTGRDFRPNDSAVAIVNESFARQYFNGANPVGKWFERQASNATRTRIEVIGLVHDMRTRDLHRPVLPSAYVPFDAQPRARGTFVVRTAGDPGSMAGAMRQVLIQAQPNLRIHAVRTQLAIDDSNTLRERLLATLAFFFAGVALVLAAVGLYGVLDYSVVQRRREIAIRLAIGARSGEIAKRITGKAVLTVVTGILAGLGAGEVLAHYAESLFYGVKATDLGSVALPAGAILATALLAVIPPVVRALRTDPTRMLRAE